MMTVYVTVKGNKLLPNPEFLKQSERWFNVCVQGKQCKCGIIEILNEYRITRLYLAMIFLIL